MSEKPPIPPEGITFYQLLGVEEDASSDEIEKQYRRLVRVYHPDTCDLKKATEITKRLHTARKVLTNPRKRQTYDRQGHEEYTGELTNWASKSESITEVYHNWMFSDEDDNQFDGNVDLSDPPGDGDTWDFGSMFDSEESIDEISTDETTNDTDYSIDDNITFTDKVESQSSSRERKFEFSQLSQERDEKSTKKEEIIEETNSSSEKDITPTQENDESIKSLFYTIYNNFDDVLDYSESFFSQDIVSKAVRRAWVARLSISIVTFTITLILGVGLGRIGIDTPLSQESLSTAPEIALPLLVLITIVVFAVDQYNTEQDVNRGDINAAKYDLNVPLIGFSFHVMGVLLLLSALLIGGQPIEFFTEFISTLSIPEIDVWSENPIINVLLTSVMMIGFLVGYLVGVPTLTRFIWYDRYVNGYRMLPFWWDTALTLPVYVYMWALFTDIEYLDLPTSVGEIIVTVLGPIAPILGITPNVLPINALFTLFVLTPFVLSIVYVVRTMIASRD